MAASYDYLEPIEEIIENFSGSSSNRTTATTTTGIKGINNKTEFGFVLKSNLDHEDLSKSYKISFSAVSLSFYISIGFVLLLGFTILIYTLNRKYKRRTHVGGEEADSLSASVSSQDNTNHYGPGSGIAAKPAHLQTTGISSSTQNHNSLPKNFLQSEAFTKVRFQNFDSRYKILEEDD